MFRWLMLGLAFWAAGAAAQPEPLVVGTRVVPPFVIENDAGELSGISIELWERVAADMGLEYEYRRTDLAGMLDGVENGGLDVAVGALTMTAERERSIDFTHPFHTSGLAVAARPGGSAWTALAGFFSGEFLLAVAGLGALLLAVGVVIWVFERRGNPEEFGGTTVEGLGSGFWWAAVTMTTVGYGDKSPRTLGGRVVGLIWMFAAIILISGFTAAIATSLTVGSLDNRIEGVDDLRRTTVATVDRATSGRALDARDIPFRPVADVEAGLDDLAAGRVEAVVYDAPILQYLVNHEYPRRATVLPFRFERQDYALALPEGSDLREPMNRRILAIVGGEEWDDVLADYLGERP